MKRVEIPLPAKGIDIRTSDTSLQRGTVRSMRNVTITDTGEMSLRPGYTQLSAGTDFKGLFSTKAGVLVHRGAELLLYRPATNTFVFMESVGASPMIDVHEYNDLVYVTHETGLLKIDPTAKTIGRAGVALPDITPSISSGTGILPAGRYGVAATALGVNGEESPAVFLGDITVTTGGITVTGMPTDGRTMRIYCSTEHGDILYLALEAPSYLGSMVITALGEGRVCPTFGKQLFPGGQFVRGLAGRLYMASGDTLWYSDPLNPHLVSSNNFVRFTGQIRFIEAMNSGLFVGDSRGTWWIDGTDPEKAQVRLCSTAVPGFASSVMVPSFALPIEVRDNTLDQKSAMWMTPEGHVLGKETGLCKSIVSDRISTELGVDGKSAFLQAEGLNQVISLTATPWGLVKSAKNSFDPTF